VNTDSAVQRLCATSWSLYLPGVRPASAFAGRTGESMGAWAWQDSPPPDQAAAVLGRKGLLAVEPVTRLALCAVQRALGLPPAQWPATAMSPRTAVVACGNLGIVEAVTRVARTVAAGGGRSVSVLDISNVSGNVVAATVARRFGFGGPNLMVCSGAAAGLDGLRMAALLLRARRADRVVLVGAEHAGDAASALRAGDDAARPLRDGAACLVLQAPRSPADETRGQVSVDLMVDGAARPRRPRLRIGPDGLDLVSRWGDYYGAHVVVALSLAAHLVAEERYGAVGIRCEGENGDDSPASLVVSDTHPGGD
jgi:3-oxoacyl-[acyl-carrier-protein] synthase II